MRGRVGRGAIRTQFERESTLRRLARGLSARGRVGRVVKTRGAQYEKKNGFGHVARGTQCERESR